MITDTAKSHGSFFSLLLDRLDVSISLRRLRDIGSGYYLINESVPICLKISSKRKGPWTFNFLRIHQETQEKLFRIYGELFICLICGKDGVVGLSMQEFRKILDDHFEDQESITVRRRLKTMYHVMGRDGVLENRVSRQAIFEKIIQALSLNEAE